MTATVPRTPATDLDAFLEEAETWLRANAEAVEDPPADEPVRLDDSFRTSVFHALPFDEELDLIRRIQAWNLRKASRGYHAITWPRERGGLDLSRAHAKGFARLESRFRRPGTHEVIGVTAGLVAPTIELYGTPEQKDRLVASFLRTEELCCQLFSEPGAGSDLASLSCRAERDGDGWIVNGQKVWSSGAQFAQFGELIARTDPAAPKHAGMTAFIIPLDLPGIEVRPIKQMSGGSSFNEVFFTDVRIPDLLRLGEVGEGWKVAMTTLSFERDHADAQAISADHIGGTFPQLLATARALGVTDDHVVRQWLARVHTQTRVESLVNRRVAQLRRAGVAPGPEGSIGKLLWTQGMTLMTAAASAVLGAKLVADTGEPGTYAWAEHVLGAPGYRIAGGSDEIQRNIIGERVLGLPREPQPGPETGR